jgi:hypothetical protein
MGGAEVQGFLHLHKKVFFLNTMSDFGEKVFFFNTMLKSDSQHVPDIPEVLQK